MTTGIAPIDEYLHRLDAELTGSASVRMVTLNEARDFLLEAWNRAASSRPDREVATAAETFAIPARSDGGSERIARVFRSASWRLGLGVAVLMLLFEILRGTPAEFGWWAAFFEVGVSGLLAGVLMGLYRAYGSAPTMPGRDGPGSGQYTVRYPRSSLIAGVGLLVGFGVLFGLTVAGMLGFGFASEEAVGIRSCLHWVVSTSGLAGLHPSGSGLT